MNVAYAGPFPKDDPTAPLRKLVFEPTYDPIEPFQLGGLTEEDVRRVIREELERLRGPCPTCEPHRFSSLEDVMCRLGDAHLLEQHPMEDPPGAD